MSIKFAYRRYIPVGISLLFFGAYMPVNLISQEIVRAPTMEASYCIEFSSLDHFALGHFPLAMVYGFKHPIDPHKFKQSLAASLIKNPEMGVSIDINSDGRHMMRTGSGVELIVQECDEPMPDCNAISKLPIEDYPITYLPITPSDLVEEKIPLLGFRITRFSDGSCTLGVRLTHSHLDGNSILRFLVDIGKIYNGEDIESPATGRSKILELGTGDGKYPSAALPIIPLTETKSMAVHSAPPNNRYTCRQIIFPKGILESYIATIKAQNGNLSSSDIICSLSWKAWARSSSMEGDRSSFLYRLFNLRSIKELGLPDSYQGNAAIDRFVDLTFAEVRNSPVEKLAVIYQKHVKPLRLQELTQDIAYLNRLLREQAYGKDGNFTGFLRKFSFDILGNQGLFVNDMRFLKLDQLKFSSEAVWYAAGQDYSLPGYIEVSRIYDGTIFFRHHSLVEHAEPFEQELRKLVGQ